MAFETVDTLLLGTGVDLAGLQTGLKGATALVDSFASGLDLGDAGAHLGDDLVAGLEEQFQQRRSQLQEHIASGLVDPNAIGGIAGVAADRFTTGLEDGLQQANVAQRTAASVGNGLDDAFAVIGRNAGAALAAAVENTIARTTNIASAAQGATASANAVARSAAADVALGAAASAATTPVAALATDLSRTASGAGVAAKEMGALAASTQDYADAAAASAEKQGILNRLVSSSGDEFTHAGRRGVEAVLGIGLALSSVAEGADDTSSRIQNVLRTITGFGLLLGPEGIIVSATAASLEAVVSIITETNKQLDKALQDEKSKIQQVLDQHDLTAFTNELQRLTPAFAQTNSLLGTAFSATDSRDAQRALQAVGDELARIEAQKRTLEGSLPFGAGFLVSLVGSDQERAQQLSDLAAELDLFKKLREAAAHPEDTQHLAGTLPRVTVFAFDPTVVSEDVKKLTASLQALGGVASVVNDRFKSLATPGLLPLTAQGEKLAVTINQQALAAVDRLTTRLAAQHGVIDADTLALLQMLKQFEQFDAVKVLRLRVPALSQEKLELTVADLELLLPKPPTIPVDIQPNIKGFDAQEFDAVAKHLTDLQDRAAALAAAGDTTGAQQARVAAVQQTQLLADSEKDVLANLVAMGAPANVVAQVFARMRDTMKQLGIDTAKVGANLTVPEAFSTLGQDVSSLNNALGETATRAGAAFTAIGQLITAFQALQTESQAGVGFDFATLAGGITSAIGAVGAVASLIGGLFQESPTQKEHDAILEQNNQALISLKQSLDHFGQTGASLDALEKALAKIPLTKDTVGGVGFFAGGGSDVTSFLFHKLAQAGIDWTDFLAIAKQEGIQILDKNGHLVQGALQQLEKALGVTAAKVLTFGQDFQSQVNLQQLIDKALGTSSPALDFSETAAQFQKQARFAFNDFFGNLDGADFSHLTADQIAEFRQDLANLLKAIQLGTISLAELGNFTDVGQLEQAASQWLDSLNAMSDAADSVTQSLLNVPTGFKLALAEFNATTPADLIPHPGTPTNPVIPVPIQTIPTPIGIDDPNVGRVFSAIATKGMPIDQSSIDTLATRLADAIVTAARGGATSPVVLAGDVNVIAGDRDAAELTNQILTELRTRALGGKNPLSGVVPS